MMSIEQVEELLNIWGFPHHHWELTVGNTQLAFNPKTMIMTWVVMILVALFAVAATRKMSLRRPTGAQNMFELCFESIWGLVKQNMDARKGQTIITVVVTYFIFILFANLIGLVPTLTSPTADYNTTLALSLCTFALIYVMGVKYKGLGYFKHYVTPNPIFLPINILEDVSKPITLTFRLYGNIYGGEVLIVVLLGLITGWVHFLGGFVASVLWLAFSIFVGCIQAFLFTMLSIAYFSMAVSEDH
jgi:F-type H+-transporting ATPase subunit a